MNVNDFCEWLFEQRHVRVVYINEGVYVELLESSYVVVVEGLEIIYVKKHDPFNPQHSRLLDIQFLIYKIEEYKDFNDRAREFLSVENPTSWDTGPTHFDVDLWNYIRGR